MASRCLAAGACVSFFAGIGFCLLVGQFLPVNPGLARRLEAVGHWADHELSHAIMIIHAEIANRGSLGARAGVASQASEVEGKHEKQSCFKYVHKHTYATGDLKAAAYFVAKYFGAWCNHEPGHGKQRTHCKDTEFEQPMTWNAYFPASLEQPLGFSIHFVKNPHKFPAQAPMNETELGLLVEKWRGNFSQTGRFDQFMDNHLGLVFDTLDPLVEKWQRDGVPFICRSWCCGPGMEQWPDRCPFGPSSDMDFCEQGCYVEVPHGIILEALCGMENYTASRKCLTKVGPHQLKSFDLCSDNWLGSASSLHAHGRICCHSYSPGPVKQHQGQQLGQLGRVQEQNLLMVKWMRDGMGNFWYFNKLLSRKLAVASWSYSCFSKGRGRSEITRTPSQAPGAFWSSVGSRWSRAQILPGP